MKTRETLRTLILGTESIENPTFGGEQRSHWVDRIYRDHREAWDIAHDYFYDAHFMAYFRPRKRGLGNLLLPFEAVRRGVPLSFVREMGNRPAAASKLHARRSEYQALVDAADLVHFEHPFAFPFVEDRLEGKAVVYSSHNVESTILFDYFRRIQPDAREGKALEERMIRVEDALVRRADLVISCTESDSAHYEKVGAQRLQVAPNGALPLATLHDPERAASPFARHALFISSAWNPNAAALLKYCAELKLPEETGLVCAGAIGNSTYPGFERLRSNPSIHFTGRVEVDRLAALAAGASALIVPALDAGGSNIKTAEALLTDKPIIATPQAFRGYEGFRGALGVRLCETPETFCAQIAEHLTGSVERFPRPEAEAVRWPNALRPAADAIEGLIEEIRKAG